MEVRADAGKCQGYGNCVAIDPVHFDLDDDGIVVVIRSEVTAADLSTTEEAIRNCPVSALWLEGN